VEQTDTSTNGEQEPRERYHETDFHGSHPSESRHDTEPLSATVRIGGEERSVAVVVEVERLRREHTAEFRTLMEAVESHTQRAVLASLLSESPRTYRDLSEWTKTTTRTVKTHVSELSEAGILRVEDGRPATISFVDDDLRLLASDVLSFY